MSGKGVIHKIKIFLKCKKEQKKNMCCRVHLNNNVLKKQKKKIEKIVRRKIYTTFNNCFPLYFRFNRFIHFEGKAK